MYIKGDCGLVLWKDFVCICKYIKYLTYNCTFLCLKIVTNCPV